MRELAATMASTEAIDEAAFADYKRKVADYLSGFWRELGQHADAIGAQVAQLRADPEGEALMLEALISVAPHPRLSEREVRERQLALLRRQWTELAGWFGAGDSPLRSLDAHLHAAIDWILRGVRRLRERRVQRVNRSSEYRALAKLFADAPDERACHAIHAAAFGLYGARHLAVPELDADLVSPGESWWDAPFAPVQGYLRRPGTGETAAGRAAPVADGAESQLLALEEELRRRALVDELLDRLPGERDAAVRAPRARRGVLRSAAGRDRPGAHRRHDRLLRRRHAAAEVVDMGADLPAAAISVGDGGVLESPDLLVKVGRV